jgi:hypothetical protein
MDIPHQASGRKASLTTRCGCRGLCAGLRLSVAVLATHGFVVAVTITEAEYEGRAQFKVVTESATYYYDKAGGGFSRLMDRDGKDWISFHKEPLKRAPASAAAGFRGIPNLVFGRDNPDAGAGHAGFDLCESVRQSASVIRTVSRSGRWAWSWEFFETNAVFTMEKADPEHAWWFLYEGTIAGRWSPATHYWGTDEGGPRRDTPDNKQQQFGSWRWVYFGDDAAPRVLLAVQRSADDLPDTLWYMGASAEGLRAADGMVVFGFGRGPGARPQFRGAGESFVLGFVESAVKDGAGHAVVAATADSWLRSKVSE